MAIQRKSMTASSIPLCVDLAQLREALLAPVFVGSMEMETETLPEAGPPDDRVFVRAAPLPRRIPHPSLLLLNLRRIQCVLTS